jgi:hypothetical protein
MQKKSTTKQQFEKEQNCTKIQEYVEKGYAEKSTTKQQFEKEQNFGICHISQFSIQTNQENYESCLISLKDFLLNRPDSLKNFNFTKHEDELLKAAATYRRRSC